MTATLQSRRADSEWRVASTSFPAVAAAVPQSRRFVERHLQDRRLQDRAALLVSELATNAVEHAATDFEVTVVTRADAVRLEVADGSTQPPMLRVGPLESEDGRGLRIVAAMADRWGVETRPGATGKLVWCELALHPPCPASRVG